MILASIVNLITSKSKKVGDVKDAEGKSAALLSPFRVDSLQREGIFSTYSLICSPIACLVSGYTGTPSPSIPHCREVKWSRSSVSVGCTNSFTPIFYLAFSLLFVAFVPSFLNSIIISIIISVTHRDFHSYHIYIKSIMHPRCWIIQLTTWTRRGWFIFKTDTYS